MDIRSCTPKSLGYLQSNLRIVDPLYGTLRPLDVMQPYRLEMATKAIMKDLECSKEHKSLSSWWSESITNSITNDLNDKEEGQKKYLINLASDEYSAAINCDLLPDDAKFIKIVFQQEGRVIAVHAKRARGLMARFIADNDVVDLESLQNFDVDGYSFQEDKSNDEMLVFDRPKPKPEKKVQKRKIKSSSSSSTTSTSKESKPKTRKRK